MESASTQSSRVFVKSLPPTFTDDALRTHFSQVGSVTDVKTFPGRRIGYVGYKTPQDAQKAVKYFNRTFIRMSRIGVELARPPREEQSRKSTAPAAYETYETSGSNISDGNLKRKREVEHDSGADPKLQEFLDVMQPKSKKKAWEADALGKQTDEREDADIVGAVEAGQSDEEYEVVPRKAKAAKPDINPESHDEIQTEVLKPIQHHTPVPLTVKGEDTGAHIPDRRQQTSTSDADWARSRTNRLLGLLDDEEEQATVQREESASPDDPREEGTHGESAPRDTVHHEPVPQVPTPPTDEERSSDSGQLATELSGLESTMRLFIRNLPYDVSREDLAAEFAAFGDVEEVHVSTDKKTGLGKGFALIQFITAAAATAALLEKDGCTFQGRLLHILPASAKRQSKLDDFALSKLPLKKQQQIRKRREAESTTFNWNSLYMNADAVVSSVADRLGLSKSEVLDPTSSDAAVKQAHAETHIIQETKAYFREQGVDLDAFQKSQRGETAILVKNIPYDCSKDELMRLFEEHGDIVRFLMPPSGIIAIIEFANAAQCKAAFGALAYRKVKSSVLFLEKAPKHLFDGKSTMPGDSSKVEAAPTASNMEPTAADFTASDGIGSATVFVRNLNFITTTADLVDTFSPLDGFLTARVKTKTDAKKPGQVLSMGFGFLEFRSIPQAQAAIRAMDGYDLAGHKLQLRASHKGADAAEDRRKADAAKKAAGKNTKVIIKNLPFEATKKDVRALFGAYGKLRSVRVPKKMDRAARGFAFADFVTPKEAESAMDALKDTHLLGRRLVLDFAAGDAEDAEAEIEKMQKKVGAQVNKVALQKLTSGGRKKFTTAADENDEA